MINPIHITYSPTYPSVETDDICIAIDNGSDNTVGGSYYSAHQAVGKFAELHIEMVSCVHRKCQTRAGVSGDVNKKRKEKKKCLFKLKAFDITMSTYIS